MESRPAELARELASIAGWWEGGGYGRGGVEWRGRDGEVGEQS